MSKKSVLQKQIRSQSKRNHIPNRECFMTGQKNGLENHHIISVHKIVEFKQTHPYVSISDIPKPTMDLISPKHKIIHNLQKEANHNISIIRNDMFGVQALVRELEEIKVASDILNNEWKEDYKDMVNDTICTIEDSICELKNEELIDTYFMIKELSSGMESEIGE